MHQVSWLREPYASAVQDTDFTVDSLYAALAEHGVAVHRASERLLPAALDSTTAQVLGQPEGAAVFVSERLTYALDDTPVVLDRATIVGTLVEVRTERAATGLSVRWTGRH